MDNVSMLPFLHWFILTPCAIAVCVVHALWTDRYTWHGGIDWEREANELEEL